ncbi:MAG: ABC transporter permease [Acidobacteria bacterium]|nr:ABC transporter permease [Acidobacteriota bacterium]
MNTKSSVPTDLVLDSRSVPPARMASTRPLWWSIRRELWENRSLTIAPLAVSGFVLLVMLVTAFGVPRKMGAFPPLDPAKQHALAAGPFSMAASAITITTILVGIFYSLDALYGERRDRSILFWKSLPVSDRTTVLSKAAIPLVVLPLIGVILSVATQLIILIWTTGILVTKGMSPATLWSELPLLEMPLVLLYGVGVFTLWHAPIYGWLLLVSGWARRTPVLWAALPFFAISVAERIAFNTSHFASWMSYRFAGALPAAFHVTPAKRGHVGIIDRFAQLDPARFLSTPGLWTGLLLAAVFFAVAVRLRRYREPM